MPRRDPGVYLEDIEHYAAAAVRFMAGCSLQQYLADDRTRAAVERALEVCGKVFDIAVNHAPALLAAVREALKDYPEPKVPPDP